MEGLVVAFNGVLYLSKNLLCHPVVNMLRFELSNLFLGKDGMLRVASEVAIVSKSHQIAQIMFIHGVPGHDPRIAYFKDSVEWHVHLC